ncbi:hypothetical protein MTR67_039503 [Solanum verrucosum]|uniref:Uncharacterized protein n=1 Tax=Solanum verrucosum TaxID=315347 RepID=A0AAF0UH06_SOLVR|nr:hypothetical protein MTR67_039503 [Solanum verrucosum]
MKRSSRPIAEQFHEAVLCRPMIQNTMMLKSNARCGSFGVVIRNRRSTRRFALWCISSPSCTSLQHRRVLGHWTTWYCFAELLGDAPTAPYLRRLDPFLQGSAHWNKRRSKTLRRLAKWTRRSSGLHFFVLLSLFVPFCDIVSMLSFKHQIPETMNYVIRHPKDTLLGSIIARERLNLSSIIALEIAMMAKLND